MLIIQKRNDRYAVNVIEGMSLATWPMDRNLDMSDVFPIDDNHHLADRILELDEFEPVIENGKLVDVVELPPRERVIPVENQIQVYKDNIAKSNEDLVRVIEPILPALFQLVGQSVPSEVEMLMAERRGWDAAIQELETSKTTRSAS